MKCPDCGCVTNGGICSNCQEELYILTYQTEDIDQEVSQEFADRAIEQSNYLESEKRIKDGMM